MNLLIVSLVDSLPITTDSLPIVQQAVDSTLYHELKNSIHQSEYHSNNLWMVFSCAFLFLMILGFACLETGLTRSKNAANVLFKYTLIPTIALITFIGWGYNLMYPDQHLISGFLGKFKFGIDVINETTSTYSYSFWTFILYQALLIAISICIISGAMAERIRIRAWILFCLLFAGLIYPAVGMWQWGGGWLSQYLAPTFHDFSGASLVHMVGGCAALFGAAMLGPRIGKYSEEKIMPIMGHNIPIAGIGLFLLWLGWIGFTGGAVLSSDPDKLSYVILTTFISAIAGCFGAFLISFSINRTHDITMLMNGILAGLVAISASADIMSPLESFIIGFIAGLFVVFSVLLFDKLKIDDPVGAVSVHFMCSIWGLLAVGIFGPRASKEQFISQLLGCASLILTVSILSYIILFFLRKTAGLRVSSKQELEGMDINRHGMKAYNQDGENN